MSDLALIRRYLESGHTEHRLAGRFTEADVTLAARCLARDRADWLLAEARWWANEMREIACNAADDDIARADANCVATYEVSRSDVRLQPARPPWERHGD